MKRSLPILFCLLLLFTGALGESAPMTISATPLYEAYANTEFHIRLAPEDSGRRLQEVGSGQRVSVYGYGGDWCYISCSGVVGYGKTKWLYRFRSLDPYHAVVPGAKIMEGIGRVTASSHIAVKGYGGNALLPGDLLAVSRAENGGISVPMMRSSASLPQDCLAYEPFVPWDQAGPGDMIGGFTTFFNESTGGKKLAANRRYNIELACQRVTGTVIAPGALFSYNALCGPSTKANGYRLAPNISSDGVGYGGGICQLCTTVYNAALALPLQILEWKLHRDAGVAYIPRGFDAAVGSYSDFTFKNTLPYPIRITALPQNGVLTVIIAREGEGHTPPDA